MIRFMLIVVLMLIVSGLAPSRAEVVVVVHPDVPMDVIDDQSLQRIFMGKKTRWNDDLDIVPVMLKEGLAHQEFVEGHLDRTVSRFETFWKQAMFTGRGVPPRSFATESELMFYVSVTPGAVGYVDSGTVVGPGGDSVRIVDID